MSPWLYVAVAASAIAIVAVGYIAGLGSPSNSAANNKVAATGRIESPKTLDSTVNTATSTVPTTINSPLNNNDLGPAPSAAPIPGEPVENKPNANKDTNLLVVEDQKLMDQVGSRSKFGKNVVSIMADPREKSMILTYSVPQGEHGRYMGAILADVAMEYDNRVLKVTLRGVRNGVLSYMADVPREKIMAIEVREKKDVQNLDDKNWIDEVLSDEYFKDKDVVKAPGN
jgi:hypothetical protein